MSSAVRSLAREGGRDQGDHRIAIVGMAARVPGASNPEELWELLGGEPSIFSQKWPAVDEGAAAEERLEIPVQVNGKLRSRLTVDAGTDKAVIEAMALADERACKFIGDKPVRKVVVVPGKLVNIVV